MTDSPQPKYRRILLKLSGEFLKGERDYGIEPVVVGRLAREVREVALLGVEMGIVVGGGNIFRGADSVEMKRAVGDYIGMMATLINALTLQDAIEQTGLATRLMSAIDVRQVAEPYIRRRAIRHLERGRPVIFACGTGNPFFTTDTAAALRANEIDAEILFKATGVDGVYSADPRKDPNAIKLDQVSYQEVVTKDLRIMDTSAISLCRDNRLPILVFNLGKPGNILRAVMGEHIGTLVN
jgi:uridylate kinase